MDNLYLKFAFYCYFETWPHCVVQAKIIDLYHHTQEGIVGPDPKLSVLLPHSLQLFIIGMLHHS